MTQKYLRLKPYIIPTIIIFFLVFRFQMVSFRTGYQLSYLYIASILFSIFLINKNQIYPALFVLLCAFSSFYPICSLTSINSLRFVLIGVLTYYVLVSSDVKPEHFYNILCVYCLIHIIFLILRSNGIEAYYIYGLSADRYGIGLTANPNESSMLIALCSPAFFRARWAWFIPLILVGLYLSKSTGGILSFSLIILSYSYLNDRKLMGCVLFLSILLCSWFFIHKANIGHRLNVWVAAIKLFFDTDPVIIGDGVRKVVIEKNFLTGFGLGHWQEISKNSLLESYDGRYFDRGHNTFIQCWFELGFGFLAILIGYGYNLIKVALNNNIFIYALIAIFVSCSVNSAFRINALNGFIIIVWLSIIKDEVLS